MADSDSLLSLLTTGGGAVVGGGVSALAVRALFSQFAERLKGIEDSLEKANAKSDERHKELTEKADARHERLVERLTICEGKVDAAHRRVDELGSKRRR